MSLELDSFEDRLRIAHEELEKLGVWRSNYNPPVFGLFRRLGLKLPPPYYLSFHANTAVNFIYMLVLASIVFALSQGGFDASIIDKTLLWSMLYGVFMAGFYTLRRKQLNLPDWKSVGSNK